jgi:hypothetical protein
MSAALVVVLGTAARLHADLVFLKDGTVLQGKVNRQASNFVDPASGQMVQAARIGGFYQIDDGARRVVFSHRQVQ